ncbi:hypothetical protein [Helicobacter pylori]|uniref:hypothetical protein n=1 Tax=Helicobacter pylori TaxID=210 RepID=UPI000575BC0E|nr:hypothetical protein [Helicobacter pylori]KHL87276.1 hypothetical protein HPY228_01965 [Helicobacter pylori]
MFASDVVIIFIIFFGVSFILFGGVVLFFFGKEKTILDAMMNIIFVIIVACIFFPWLPGLLFYMFGFLALHVIP